MEVLITDGVEISVSSKFLPEHSNVSKQHFAHGYHITIRNLNSFTVQLLRRKWMIFDSDLEVRQVEGEGVIGQQPILKPGEQYSYESWSQLHTPIGSMTGNYSMIRFDNNQIFSVVIPKFALVADFKLN